MNPNYLKKTYSNGRKMKHKHMRMNIIEGKLISLHYQCQNRTNEITE